MLRRQGIIKRSPTAIGQHKSVMVLPEAPDIHSYQLVQDQPLGRPTLRIFSHGYLDSSSTEFHKGTFSGDAVVPPPHPTLFHPPMVMVRDNNLTSDEISYQCEYLNVRLRHLWKTSGEGMPVTDKYNFVFDTSMNRCLYGKDDRDVETARYLNDLGRLLIKAKETLMHELAADTDEEVCYRAIIVARNLVSTIQEIRVHLLAMGLMLDPVVTAETDPVVQLDRFITELMPFI